MKIGKILKGIFFLTAFSLVSCSDIFDSKEENSSISDGFGIVRFKISENLSDSEEAARTIFPTNEADSVADFEEISLSYGTVKPVEIGKWNKYSDLASFQAAVPSGQISFTLKAKRYGASFSQTKTATITAGEAATLNFDDFRVVSDSPKTGKASITLKFPSTLTGISKVYVYYEDYYDDRNVKEFEEEVAYNPTENSATFEKCGLSQSNKIIICFTAKNANGEKIFSYPVGIWIVKGRLTKSTIDISSPTVTEQSANLFAKVTYKINESSISASDYEQNYYPGCKILSSENTNFSVTGKKFMKWNTVADGTGTDYYEGNTPNLTSDTTLYAIWANASEKIVTYRSNYPSGVKEAASLFTKSAESTFTISNVATTGFAVAGYNFAGWNTKADGKGTTIAAGAEYSTDKDMTLYAQWSSCIITYNMNGGSDTDTFSERIDNQTQGHGVITYRTPSPKYSYYSFAGWSRSATASTAEYKAYDQINISANTTLYAVWKLGTIVKDTSTVTVGSSSNVSLKFTILKPEELSLTIYASGSNGLDFYIKKENQILKSWTGVTSERTIDLTLEAGEYALVVGNENILLSKQAKRYLRAKGIE